MKEVSEVPLRHGPLTMVASSVLVYVLLVRPCPDPRNGLVTSVGSGKYGHEVRSDCLRASS